MKLRANEKTCVEMWWERYNKRVDESLYGLVLKGGYTTMEIIRNEGQDNQMELIKNGNEVGRGWKWRERDTAN